MVSATISTKSSAFGAMNPSEVDLPRRGGGGGANELCGPQESVVPLLLPSSLGLTMPFERH